MMRVTRWFLALSAVFVLAVATGCEQQPEPEAPVAEANAPAPEPAAPTAEGTTPAATEAGLATTVIHAKGMH